MGNELMIRTMDPILVQIYQIKDIEEIAYQDLMPAKSSGKLFYLIFMLDMMVVNI